MRLVLIVLVVVVLASCGGGEPPRQSADTLTRRQRDSAIGASGLPGARGVQRALEAADTAAARSTRLDSLSRP
ncbi:MAG TPA: hypothetical protein VNL18_09205 [Gemmatimonadales bacterium]|nr:hypothetical protein [Gemmatimonadales bacterium]